MRLACGAIKQKHGIIADINAARKVLRGTRLDADRKIGGMRKGSAGALRGHGELSRGGIERSAEHHRYVLTRGHGKGAGRIADDAGGHAGQGDLHVSRKAIFRGDGNGDGRACAALRQAHRRGRERDGEVWLWRRGLDATSATSSTAACCEYQDRQTEGRDSSSASPHGVTPVSPEPAEQRTAGEDGRRLEQRRQ